MIKNLKLILLNYRKNKKIANILINLEKKKIINLIN